MPYPTAEQVNRSNARQVLGGALVVAVTGRVIMGRSGFAAATGRTASATGVGFVAGILWGHLFQLRTPASTVDKAADDINAWGFIGGFVGGSLTYLGHLLTARRHRRQAAS